MTEPKQDNPTMAVEALLKELFNSALGECFNKELLTDEVITKAIKNSKIQEITTQYIGFLNARLRAAYKSDQWLVEPWLKEIKQQQEKNNKRTESKKCSNCGSDIQFKKTNKSTDEAASVKDVEKPVVSNKNNTSSIETSKNNASHTSPKETNTQNHSVTETMDTPKVADASKSSVLKESENSVHSTTETPETLSSLRPGAVPPPDSTPVKVTPPTKISFYLPNSKIGVEYKEKITINGDTDGKIRIIDVRIPEDFGLKFDAENQFVSGMPLKSGEFDLTLKWRDTVDGHEGGAKCQLVVNPDPRSLWKVIEPDSSLPYHKSHTDEAFIEADGYKLVAASRRGRSHEHQGSFRDDDFFIKNLNDNWSILIVADGAGSAANSREGSRIAVQTAGQLLSKKIEDELGQEIKALLSSWDDVATQKLISDKFYYCFYDVAKNAIQNIESEAEQSNLPSKDYSTTLLAAVVKRDKEKIFLATFWMGDGAIAAYNPNGVLKLMGTPDSGEYAGQTRFLDKNALADKDFIKRIGIGYYSDISAVILMTDGVSDPYFETDSALADKTKWDVLWKDFSSELNNSQPGLKLVEWLHFFKPGHHDDRTIALLW